MDECDFYFVGWMKHGQVQFLKAGPFLDWETATAAFTEPDRDAVVRLTVPCKNFEVLD